MCRVVNSSALVSRFRFGWSMVTSTAVNLVQRLQMIPEKKLFIGLLFAPLCAPLLFLIWQIVVSGYVSQSTGHLEKAALISIVAIAPLSYYE